MKSILFTDNLFSRFIMSQSMHDGMLFILLLISAVVLLLSEHSICTIIDKKNVDSLRIDYSIFHIPI